MSNEQNIRRLLKTFGIQADEAVTAYFRNHPQLDTLHIRLVLEDVTDYGADEPAEPLRVEIEGEIGS
jgi:pyrroloquinoline quinone (PQQ) biosynthesis protein C